jgi:hypothetical protein
MSERPPKFPFTVIEGGKQEKEVTQTPAPTPDSLNAEVAFMATDPDDDTFHFSRPPDQPSV